MNLTPGGSGASRRLAGLAVAAILAADLAALAVRSDDSRNGADLVAGPAPGETVPARPPTSLVPPSSIAPPSTTLPPPPTTTSLPPTTLAPTTVPPPPPAPPASLLGLILFISNRTSPPPQPTSGPVTPGSGGYELWAMAADGSDQRQLTSDGQGNAQPSLAPDGTRVAWVKGDSAVWVMNADGTNAAAVTDSSGIKMSPRWSPDGNRIAYTRVGDEGHDIVIMNADGGDARVLSTSGVDEYSASWSPDGERLAITVSGADPGLLIMDVVSTAHQWIRRDRSGGAAWSPDGSVILFSDGRHLHTVAAEGTGLRQLTSGPGQHLAGAWSRDGRTIAVDYFSQQPGADSQIHIMNADGSGLRNITNAPGDNYEATF